MDLAPIVIEEGIDGQGPGTLGKGAGIFKNSASVSAVNPVGSRTVPDSLVDDCPAISIGVGIERIVATVVLGMGSIVDEGSSSDHHRLASGLIGGSGDSELSPINDAISQDPVIDIDLAVGFFVETNSTDDPDIPAIEKSAAIEIQPSGGRAGFRADPGVEMSLATGQIERAAPGDRAAMEDVDAAVDSHSAVEV